MALGTPDDPECWAPMVRRVCCRPGSLTLWKNRKGCAGGVCIVFRLFVNVTVCLAYPSVLCGIGLGFGLDWFRELKACDDVGVLVSPFVWCSGMLMLS